MWEAPDKRVWFIFPPMFLMGLLAFFAPTGTAAEHFLQTILFAVWAIGSATLGFLSMRDGYYLLYPSHTQEEWPVLFWIDTLGSFIFAGMTTWKFFEMVSA